MTAISLANTVPASVAASVEFRMLEGTDLIARIGVHSGGQASIPTTVFWTVQASTSVGETLLTSNVIAFDGTSATILAQLLWSDGFYDFQLSMMPAANPSAIVMQNAARNPVSFVLAKPSSGAQIVKVVDEHESVAVDTAQEWQIYAIVNGITTPDVRVTNPSATVTAVATADGDFSLVVS
jgi:hypothetical protein